VIILAGSWWRLKGGKGACISSHKGGWCCLSWSSIWSSSSLCLCLQAVHVQPHNRGRLFHHYVNPCLPPPPRCCLHQHTTTEQSAAQHLLMEHVELLHNLNASEPSQECNSILRCESADCQACGPEYIIASWNQHHSLDPRLRLSHDYVLPSLFLHVSVVALSAPHNTAEKSKVKRTRFCFCAHLLVSPDLIQNALISAVTGEGCASQAVGTWLWNTTFSWVVGPQALH